MVQQSDVLVIGGGVIGACCAYELARGGASVTLVERDVPPAIDSGVYANAGLITPGDVFPLASPGVLGKGLKWLLDSGSPFYVAPLAEPGLTAWLAQFAQYATDEHVRRSMPVQRALLRQSADLFAEWAAAIGPECDYQQLGWLMLYETADALSAARDRRARRHRTRRRHRGGRRRAGGGARARRRRDLRRRHPLRRGRPRRPRRLRARGRRAWPPRQGATCASAPKSCASRRAATRVTRVVTTRGEFTADTVVLAAGAWSPVLAKQVGLHLPVQAAKGYSVTVPRPDGVPDMPLYLTERHVVATPLGDRLRFAGTLELVGFDLSVRWKRVQRIREGGDSDVPRHGRASEPLEVWRGLRPCTPDGLPIIGRSPHHANLVDRHRPLHARPRRRADHRPPRRPARRRRDAADRPRAAARRPLRDADARGAARASSASPRARAATARPDAQVTAASCRCSSVKSDRGRRP